MDLRAASALLFVSFAAALRPQLRSASLAGQDVPPTGGALSLAETGAADGQGFVTLSAQVDMMDMFAAAGTTEDSAGPCTNRPHFTMEATLMATFFGGLFAAAFFYFRALGTCEDESSGQPAGRSAILDNAKFLLMVAVILGHFSISVEYKDQWPWVTEVRRFVQFHVLTYCFISGLVSRSPVSAKGIKSLMVGVAGPWILNAFILAPVMNHFVYATPIPNHTEYNRAVKDVLIHPGVAWYLPCLILWRAWGWVIMPLAKYPGARLAVALAFAATTGYYHLEADPLPWLERATAFFPVFVLGQIFPLDWVLARVQLNATNLAVGVFILAAIFAFEFTTAGGYFVDALPHFGWGRVHFCGMEQAAFYWVRQLGRHSLELSKGLVLLFLCTPRQNCFMTALGRYSLYTYLLHWYVVIDLRKQYFPLPASPNAGVMVLGWLAALAMAVVVNVVFASAAVRTVFWPVLEPVWLEGRYPWQTPAAVKGK